LAGSATVDRVAIDLNEHWYGSLAEARRTIETWRRHYNEAWPHSALGYETPEAYA